MENLFDLDKLIRETPAGGIIKLSPGIYTTMGYGTYPSQVDLGERAKVNVTIIGAGVGLTTIKCIRKTADCTVVQMDTGGSISDVTVDCNPPPTFQTGSRSGVRIEGGGYINRVKVINLFGSLEGRKESFGLVAGHNHKPGIGYITNCQVTSILGNYSSAIMGTFVENCSVEWHSPLEDNIPHFRVAYNIGDSVGVRLSNCRCRNAEAAVYADTLLCLDARIFNCVFTNVRRGFNFNMQTTPDYYPVHGVRGIKIFDNTIYLQRTGKGIAGVQFDHTTKDSVYKENTQNYIHDVQVYNNTFRFVEAGEIADKIPPYPAVVNCASFTTKEKTSPTLGVSKILFASNFVDSRMTYRNRNGVADIVATPAVVWLTNY